MGENSMYHEKQIEFRGSDPGKNIKIDFFIRFKRKNFIFFSWFIS